MIVAFSTLILFCILTPGYLAQRAYFSADFSKRYYKSSIMDEYVLSMVPGILIQLIGILFLTKIMNVNFDFKVIGEIFSGTASDKHTSDVMAQFTRNTGSIITYICILCIFSYCAGASFRGLIRFAKLDRHFAFFRFENKWHYLLSGEILDFNNFQDSNEKIKSSKEIDFCYIDVLVELDGIYIIYSGIQVDHSLSGDGNLNMIFLKKVYRTYFTDVDATLKEFKETSIKEIEEGNPQTFNYSAVSKQYSLPIPGSVFFIPGSSIVNLNITYAKLEKA